MLYDFWARNNKICHYFLFHLFLKIVFDKYDKDYKNIPFYSSKPIHMMQKNLFLPFHKLKYKSIISNVSMHKLTRKRTTNKTKGLVYHHILEKYIF